MRCLIRQAITQTNRNSASSLPRVLVTALIEDGLKTGKFSAIKLCLGSVWKSVNDPFYEPACVLAEK